VSGGGRLECEAALARRLVNPFLVLALPLRASREQIEREGAKLLAMLAAEVPGAAAYETPAGTRERSAELVRAALAELRDPDRRLVHEQWARGLVPR
jgi:hypothetical protein